ncbi:MAG: hypothetical protein QXD15_01390 [Thermoplasmata archaeon]
MFVRDNHALEGLPLKLTIIGIVLGISIPLIFGAFISYDKFNTEQQLRNELYILANAAKKVYLGNVNSSDVVKLHINEGFFTKIEYIKIGGALDDKINRTSIVYKLTNLGEGKIVITDPNINMTSEDNKSLTLGRGLYTLILTCKYHSQMKGIYVEVKITT